MKRVLALIPRKPDLTREAFRDHYENVHAPLGMTVLEDIPHYVRDHVSRSIGGVEPTFDVLSEFGYADPKALQALSERLASKGLGDPIRADELRFMDKPRIVHFPLTPVAHRLGPATEATLKLVLLEKAPAGSDRSAFVSGCAHRVKGLAADASSTTFRSLDPSAPYDVVSVLRCPVATFDQATLRRELMRDDQAQLLLVEECATRICAAWEDGHA